MDSLGQISRRQTNFFEEYGQNAIAILKTLLDKYAKHGVEEFNIPTTFKANREFNNYGNVVEIAQQFGSVQQLREVVNQLQEYLYSAST